MLVLIAAVIILIIFLLYKNNKEYFSIVNYQECKDCKLYNHLDINTECKNTCKKHFLEKNNTFTGKLTNNKLCECSFDVDKKTEYIKSSKKAVSSDKSLDTFIFNNEEAKKICSDTCHKIMPEALTEWTGKWRNDNLNSSSCECSYYI